MTSRFSLQLRDAFVVTEDALKKIHRLLADRIGNPTITAECADDVSRDFDDLAALMNYENPKDRQILSLRLYARSDDFKKTASVDFSDKWYFGGTSISIEARDDVVSRLRSALLDIVGGMRPWYHRFNKIDLWLAALICYGVVWLSLVLFVAISGSPSTGSDTSPKTSATAQLIFWGFTGLMFGGAYILHRFRKRLFPHGTFKIGQATGRFETLEKWRWGFVIAFAASFVAGIVLLVLQLTLQG